MANEERKAEYDAAKGNRKKLKEFLKGPKPSQAEQRQKMLHSLAFRIAEEADVEFAEALDQANLVIGDDEDE